MPCRESRLKAQQKALTADLQISTCSQCGEGMSKREREERWWQRMLRTEGAFLPLMGLQDTGSPSFTWCSLHLINCVPRCSVTRDGSLPYFHLLVNILAFKGHILDNMNSDAIALRTAHAPQHTHTHTHNTHTHTHTHTHSALWPPGTASLPCFSPPSHNNFEEMIQGKQSTSDYFYPEECVNSI